MIKLKTLVSESFKIDDIQIEIEIKKSDPSSYGVSEKDLPNMQNWGLRTRDQEPYIVLCKAYYNKTLIGQSMFGYWGGENKFVKSDSVYVLPRFRKMGVANKMYDAVEKYINGNILPSAYQTSGGKGLWKKRLKNKSLGKL